MPGGDNDMAQTTLDEARDRLREAEAKFLAIETEQNEDIGRLATPERVLRQIELTGALQEAAQELIAAKTAFAEVESATAEARRHQAAVELVDIERELAEKVVRAEAEMSQLQETLGSILTLGKRRYATRHEMTGGAPMRLLARGPVAGWIKYRLGDQLDLPDLGHAEPHHRGVGLGQLLGLVSINPKEEDDDIENTN
jgi:hypothetical protein